MKAFRKEHQDLSPPIIQGGTRSCCIACALPCSLGEALLLTCLFGVLYFSLSAALETNKLQGKELELGNELIASSDAGVRNTQLSGKEGELRSELSAVLGKPSSVLLKQGFWRKKKSPRKPF